MNAPPLPPLLYPAWIVTRAALLEALRRRETSVMAVFLVGLGIVLLAARLVGIESPAAGTFLLNLTLTLVVLLTHLCTLFMAARQLPEEREHGTLYPLLARPVTRSQVVTGKWGAAWIGGIVLFAVLVIPVLALAPRLEFYDVHTLLQLLILHLLALAVTAALPLLLSLCCARGITLLLALTILLGGGMAMRWPFAARWLVVLPNPGRLNLVERYTDGIGPLAFIDFLSLLVAAVIWTVVLLWGGCVLFRRQEV